LFYFERTDELGGRVTVPLTKALDEFLDEKQGEKDECCNLQTFEFFTGLLMRTASEHDDRTLERAAWHQASEDWRSQRHPAFRV
jgi:hypothetical protein